MNLLPVIQLVKAKPPQITTKKMQWLEKQMQELRAAGMVRLNRHAICASMVMAVPKEQGF